MLGAAARGPQEGSLCDKEQRELLIGGAPAGPSVSPTITAASSATTAPIAAATAGPADTAIAAQITPPAGELVMSASLSAAAEPLLPPDASAAAPALSVSEAGAALGGGESDIRSKRRNVLLSLAFTALNTLYFSCAQGPLFDMYVFILGNRSNQ